MSGEEPILSGVDLGGKEDLDSASHFIECEKRLSDPGTDGLIHPMNGGTVEVARLAFSGHHSLLRRDERMDQPTNLQIDHRARRAI